MILHCAPFVKDRMERACEREREQRKCIKPLRCQDPDVASLLDRVNDRLGMSSAACQRFRDHLVHLA